jgi:hypothetical protein
MAAAPEEDREAAGIEAEQQRPVVLGGREPRGGDRRGHERHHDQHAARVGEGDAVGHGAVALAHLHHLGGAPGMLPK